MVFELRKVKVHKELSEETLAFSAEFFVGGKKIADINNTGKGGCNNIYLEKGVDKDYYGKIHELEVEIEEKVEDDIFRQKNQAKGFALLKGNEHFLQKFPRKISEMKKRADFKSWVEGHRLALTLGGYTILNKNL